MPTMIKLTEWAVALDIEGGRPSDHDGCDSRPGKHHSRYHDGPTKGPAQKEDPECVAGNHLELVRLRESANEVTLPNWTNRSPVIAIKTFLQEELAEVHTK